MSRAVHIDQDLVGIAAEILPAKVGPEVRTRMRQLPSRLRGGGLAATYAFICARANEKKDGELTKAYGLLADRIAQRVAAKGLLREAGESLSRDDLLRLLATATPSEYARVSAEIDALAIWLSRLSDALRVREEDAPADDGTDSGEEHADGQG